MRKTRTELDLVKNPTAWWECDYYLPDSDVGAQFCGFAILATGWVEAVYVAEGCMEPGAKLYSLRYMGTYEEYQKQMGEMGEVEQGEPFDLGEEIDLAGMDVFIMES